MAIYAGESVRIFADISGWDGNSLTQVNSALVSIYDEAGNAVVAAAPLTWNVTVQRWMYQWDSTDLPGTYDIEVDFRTLDGRTLDARTIRIEAPRRQQPSFDQGVSIWA